MNFAAQGAIGADSSRAYRNYVLFLVFVGFSINFLDRQMIGILFQPIKSELHVSDSMLGFLSGLSFAIFYVTLGVPIARLADRGWRRQIVVLSMAVWSLMTAAGGLAQNFAQLVCARIGVGIGEAGFSPAVFTMIADLFPGRSRSTATAIGGAGGMFGIMLGLIMGGVVLQYVGWRGAMLLAGTPGLVFALLFALTVREPARDSRLAQVPEQLSGWLATIATLWRICAFRYIVLAAGLSSFFFHAFLLWMPSYLGRTYGMAPSAIGFTLGPISGICGIAALVSSGVMVDSLSRRDARWAVWYPSVGALLALSLGVAAVLSHAQALTITLYAGCYFFCLFFSAPTTAAIQWLVPTQMRSTATAIHLLMINLVGLGLGPQFVGLLSTALTPVQGVSSLRIALLAVTPVLLVAVLLYRVAGRHMPSALPPAQN